MFKCGFAKGAAGHVASRKKLRLCTPAGIVKDNGGWVENPSQNSIYLCYVRPDPEPEEGTNHVNIFKVEPKHSVLTGN